MLRIVTVLFVLMIFSGTAFAEETSQNSDNEVPETKSEVSSKKSLQLYGSEEETDKETAAENEKDKEESEKEAVVTPTETTTEENTLPLNRQEISTEEETETVTAPTAEEQTPEEEPETASVTSNADTADSHEDDEYQRSWEGEDEEQDNTDDAQTDPNENRVRLEIFGGALIPSTGQDVAPGVGGIIGYDFWDTFGIELALCQSWGDTKLTDPTGGDDKSSSLQILSVRPGVKYRFYKGNLLRIYGMAHGGLEQVKWKNTADETVFENNFSFDGGLGGEMIFSNIWIIDLFASYFMGMNVMPSTTEGNLKNYHGFFIGLAVGVSSPVSKVFGK